MAPSLVSDRPSSVLPIIFAILVLALIGVYFQGGKLGEEYLRTEQLRRHLEILEGRAESPTQYRVLSEWLVELWVRAIQRVGIPDPLVVSFLSFRVAQNAIILALASVYYRRLGMGDYAVLAALAVITWSMTHSLFDSDLSFNLYSDLIFYLASGVLLMRGRDLWIVPLVGLAGLNRETSGLIVPMTLLAGYSRRGSWDRRAIVVSAAALLAFLAGYLAVRLALGPRPMMTPHGRVPGLDLLSYNLLRRQTWVHLAASWSVFPLIAILGHERLPDILRRWLIWIPPIWITIHFVLAVAAEVRLMLMPQIMIFVPAAFLAVQSIGPRRSHPTDLSPPAT